MIRKTDSGNNLFLNTSASEMQHFPEKDDSMYLYFRKSFPELISG